MQFLYQRFRKSEQGATAVEYAIVAPILLLLLLGTIEYGLVMYASAVLEGSTNAAARLAKTGYNNTSTSGTCASPTQTRQQYITCVIQTRVSGLLKANLLTVSSKSYSDYGNIGEPEPYTDINGVGHYVVGDPYTDINGNGQWDSDMGAAGLGGPGDIVVYTASYPWPIFTPMIQQFFGNNGTYTITSSAVVKNEPYPSTSR
ncbi:MAG TPA: TadE/TadG family type IV pilus assembly protein [Rickettsiales bacterium]|nr:TadE/TadG family type IV pilus assembly protein [Rickettsiales bacterium]